MVKNSAPPPPSISSELSSKPFFTRRRPARLAPGVLTSAEASHAHVVGRHHLLLDGEVVRLQRVEGRVSQDDGGVLALVLQRQQLLRADGMQRLVGLRDEAGL